jgi:hypothetical protein
MEDRLQYESTRTINVQRGAGRRVAFVTVNVYETPVRSLPEAVLRANGLRRPDPAGFARRVQALLERDAVHEETPLRPRLQRQNAMPPAEEFPVHNVLRPGAFAIVTQMIRDALEFEGIQFVEDDRAPNLRLTHIHDLLPYHTALVQDWDCGICTFAVIEDDNGLAMHPSNCHFFHAWCLNEWLYNSPTCPMCRNSGAPLNMLTKTC